MVDRGIGLEATMLHSPGKKKEALRIIDRQSAGAPAAPLFGSDLLGDAVSVARNNARRAGCMNARFVEADALLSTWIPHDFASRTGTVISNLPYGIRLLNKPAAKAITTSFARQLRSLPGWHYLLVTPHEDALRASGLDPTRRVTFLNGGVTVHAFSGVV